MYTPSKIFYLLSFGYLIFNLISCEKEVSVSPSDKPPSNGKLIINSYPKDFSIYLNDKNRIRRTPDSLTWLETGEYKLTLKKDLFSDTTIFTDVIDGARTEIFVDFSMNKNMRGNLFVRSQPQGASIFLNDSNTAQVTPHTFTELLPGIYEVKLTLEDHETVIYNAAVSSKRTENTFASLADTTIWEYFNTTNSDIPPVKLTSITSDNTGSIWIGTRYGVIKFDGAAWKHYIPDNSELPHQVVNSITTVDDGEKWIGTNDGLAIADYSNIYKKMLAGYKIYFFSVSFINDPVYPVVLTTVQHGARWFYTRGNRLNNYVILPDSVNIIYGENDRAYIGSQNKGLFVTDLDDDEKKIVNYTKENSNLPSDIILALHGSNEGIWIAYLLNETRSDLALFNGNNFEKYIFLETKQRINTIYVDSKNRKWVGADIGVFVFDNFDNKKLLNFETTGLPIKDVKGIVEDNADNIWIACWETGLFKLKNVEKATNN